MTLKKRILSCRFPRCQIVTDHLGIPNCQRSRRSFVLLNLPMTKYGKDYF